MRSVLLFIAIVGLCLCGVQAATPDPTWGAPGQSFASVNAASPPSGTTLPTVAGMSADSTSTIVSKVAAQTSRATTLPAVREATPRPSATAPTTTVTSMKATTPRPTTTPTIAATTDRGTTGSAPTPTADPNLTVPLPADSLNNTLVTPWPNSTVYGSFSPTEDRTPDIDPGMTPYSGPTELETIEPTPTWEVPANISNATPTEPPTAMPYFTAEVVQSLPFELPPGAYGVGQSPSPTETMVPPQISAPEGAAGSSFLPRWLSYLLFIFLGISGVAGLALVGSYIGSKPAGEAVVTLVPLRSASSPAGEARLLQPGAPDPTEEQQILIDQVAGFVPQSMHVERLGRNLLRLEQSAQIRAKDRSIRLGRLLILSAIPSAPVPAPATAWAQAHGFRILAVDSSGMALVMATLSSEGCSVLGVLPVAELGKGASLIPMPILLTGSEHKTPSRSASPPGTGVL